MVFAAVACAVLVVGRPVRSWGLPLTGAVIAAALVNIGLNPVMPWHTVDGALFTACGWWAIDRGVATDRPWLRRTGLFLLGVVAGHRDVFGLPRLRVVSAAAAVLLVVAAGVGVTVAHDRGPYRDAPQADLTVDLGAAIPDLADIRTNPRPPSTSAGRPRHWPPTNGCGPRWWRNWAPNLRDLHQRILTNDPDLLPAVTPTAASVAPAQPGGVHDFVARRSEIRALWELLGGPATVAVVGAGGIGKTWLVLHCAHEHVDQVPDGQLFVNLRGFEPTGVPVTPATEIRGILTALGVAADAIPVDPDGQAEP